MKKGVMILFLMAAAINAGATSVWVNEIHYDNTGTDSGEFVEIAGTAGTSLSGFSIVLYNGAGGGSYDSFSLSGTIPDQQNGFGTLQFPRSGIQNGSPDGIALIDASSTLLQFLSYEGQFTATNGVASGIMSVDIGVSETTSTTVGYSLQLTGTGSDYSDFIWSGPMAKTAGAINTGQSFSALATVPTTANSGVLFGLTSLLLVFCKRFIRV